MEEFALIKSRVNLNRVDLGIALISDLKVIPVLIDLDLFNDNQFETGWLKIFGKDNLCTGADQYLRGISPNHMHE